MVWQRHAATAARRSFLAVSSFSSVSLALAGEDGGLERTTAAPSSSSFSSVKLMPVAAAAAVVAEPTLVAKAEDVAAAAAAAASPSKGVEEEQEQPGKKEEGHKPSLGIGECEPYPPEEYEIQPNEEDEETSCALCKFMRAGPCADEFRRWEKCLTINKDRDEEYMFACRCQKATEMLAFCITHHPEYFDKSGEDEEKEKADDAASVVQDAGRDGDR
jgi:hypothetical protein